MLKKLKSSLDLSKFGIGVAKPFENLIKEINSGETLIAWEGDIPIRCISVVRVKVYCLENNCSLWETHQIFADGRSRERGIDGIAEKMFVGENPQTAALRGLSEELSLPRAAVEAIEIFPAGVCWEVKESPSYPGLRTRYEFHDFIAHFPVEHWKEEFIEITDDGNRCYFAWKAIGQHVR